MRTSSPPKHLASAGYLPLSKEERPYPSPTSPTFRKSSPESPPRRHDDTRSNHARRLPPAWLKLRHAATTKGFRFVVAALVLVALHQCVYPSFGQKAHSRITPTYTASKPQYRQTVDKTLARVGLSFGGAKDSKFVSDLEMRLLNPPLPPYQFLVGTMQHNESPDILEWLLYHISQGMDHFVVYDHFSTDHTREVLQPFIDLGWVSYVPFDDNSKYAQSAAFVRFMSRWSKLSKWHFFFDIDEFITRNETLLPAHELSEPLATWFDRKYDSYGGVALPRLSFSSNGHYQRPEGGVLENYVETRVVDQNFFSPKLLQKGGERTSGDIHRAEYSHDLLLVDPREKSGEALWQDRQDYPVYLHHYWAKSWDECVGKIKQAAFPGSWREAMGDRHCRFEMSMTEEHALIGRVHDDSLVKYAAPIHAVAERFQRSYPVFNAKDYSLSILTTSFTSTRRHPLTAAVNTAVPGTVFVVDNAAGEVGFLDVILSTSQSKRYLPLTYRSDGGASFVIPPVPAVGFYEIAVTFQHPIAPGPEVDPVSPCTVAGHFRNRPEVPQLQHLVKGVCKETDLDGVWNEAQTTWPHNHYRGIHLFRRFFQITPDVVATSPSFPFADSSTSLSPISTISSSSLGVGAWQRFPLDRWPANAPQPEAAVSGSRPRIYTPARCPSRFPESYWNEGCANDTVLHSQGGVLRFVPDGASSYADYSLSNDELRLCFVPDRVAATNPPRRNRVKIVGDSVASHTYGALQCMFDQAQLQESDHLKFASLQYESLSMAGVGNLPPLTVDYWTKLLAWEYNDATRMAHSMPDVVVINSGLWPVSWGTAIGYEKGLRAALLLVQDLLRNLQADTKLVWRETTAVTPMGPDGDPVYQTNPRVELFNSIANRITDDLGIVRIPAYEMTASRRDAARDNAHICPPVQGDMAELLVYSLCKGGIL